ncbi:MAG: VanZ family protein [Bacteroidales bacterium]
MRSLFYSYLFFLALMAILPLNGFTHNTMNQVHIIHIRLDYFLHGILYLPWCFIYWNSFRPAGFAATLLMITAGLLMAFTTEGVQYFLTYRTYNINDLLSNFLGVLLSAIALLAYIKIKPKTTS